MCCFFFKQKTAYEMRISDWSSDVCSSDLVELVSNIVQILFGLRLGREVLAPVPLVQQLLAERISVGIAFAVEASAGVAVPVPGAADAGANLERAHIQPEFIAQPVKLVKTGNAGADYDGGAIKLRCRQIGIAAVRG